MEHPQGVSNRNESAARQQVADLRDRAANQEKLIGELEKALAAVAREIAVTENAVGNLRDQLLEP